MLSKHEKQDLLRAATDMINEGLSKTYKLLLRLQEDVIAFPTSGDNIGPIIDIETQVANIIHTIQEIM